MAATQRVELVYNTFPTLTFVHRNFRNQADPTAVVDITGYSFSLMIKQSIDLPDSRAWVNLTGTIVTAADGTYKFTLTPAHTCLPPGTWPGEIRIWSGSTSNPPTDRIPLEVVIKDILDLP